MNADNSTLHTSANILEAIVRRLECVRNDAPLVHCITNYVTVESCANAVLAVGASPIMSDEPEDVVDITSICNALVINIGTLNMRSIDAMRAAGARAAELGHPIVLDPVGAGASALRTKTAAELLDSLPISIVRGNMSEIKALAGQASATQGVDVNPLDALTSDGGVASAVDFACDFASKAGCVVAITGPIDIIADAKSAYAVYNGTPLQGRITGSGCMLSAITGAYAACAGDDMLMAAVASVVHMGASGQAAQKRMGQGDGTGSFHRYLMDALSLLDSEGAQASALVRKVR